MRPDNVEMYAEYLDKKENPKQADKTTWSGFSQHRKNAPRGRKRTITQWL